MNKEVEHKIKDEVDKRTHSARQADLAVLHSVKEEVSAIKRGMTEHNTVHEADLKDIKEYHAGNTEKFFNIATKLAVIDEATKGINHRLDVLNGKVPKNTEAIANHAVILARLTAVTETLANKEAVEDSEKREDKKWWRDKYFWVFGIIFLTLLGMAFQNREMNQEQLQQIVELVNQSR